MPYSNTENSQIRHCKICGEELNNKYWSLCPYCYWKDQLEKSEPLNELHQRLKPFKEKKKVIQPLHESAKNKYKAYYQKLKNEQSKWKRWLDIEPTDTKLISYHLDYKNLSDELIKLQHQIDPLEKSIKKIRYIRSKFNEASRWRATFAKLKQRSHQFEHEMKKRSDDYIDKTDFDRSLFKIRKKDYKRGNLLDNHFRNVISNQVIIEFQNRCLHCNGTYDLTLDHYAIPKNEGGNFVLYTKVNDTIVLNIIVLCRSCNASKGEKSYVDFFTPEEHKKVIQYHKQLLQFIINDKETMKKIRTFYMGK